MPTLDAATTPTTTRRSLQALAEHVLSAALFAATGHIGLRRTVGGFGTPVFDHEGHRRQIMVRGTDLEVRDGDRLLRAPITTLRAAGELAKVEPGAPRDIYSPSTPLALDTPLVVDADQAEILADWYTLVDEALELLIREAGDRTTAIVQLWPEHFDLAVTIDEVNYGGSPGDAAHELPYLYVGPWSPPPKDDFWNETFGASRCADEIDSMEDAITFFREGRARLR